MAVIVAVLFVLLAAPAAAQTQVDAVVDAASFTVGVLPYGLGTVFGAGLALRTENASAIPLPTTLGGVELQLCDQDGCDLAELIYVDPGQINFYAATPRFATYVRVVREGVMVAEAGVEDGGAVLGHVKGPAIFQYALQDCPIDRACDEMLWRPAVTDQAGRLVTRANPLRPNGFYTVWYTGSHFAKRFEPFGPGETAEHDLTNFWTRVNVGEGDFWDPRTPSTAEVGRIQDRPYIRYAGPSPEFPGLSQLVFQLDPNAVWVRRCTEVWLSIMIRPDDITSQYATVPMCPE